MEALDLLRENLGKVRAKMEDACRRAGRSEDSVALLVVTKSVTPEAMRLLWRLGVTQIGENRVQEALRKAEKLGDCGFGWHMVGHLQRNKVKAALGLFELIHSVDSARLADEIQNQAARRSRIARVLVEINVSGDEAKFGMAREGARGLVEHISSLGMLSLEGLMTMAPLVEDAEETRRHFAALRELRDELNAGATLRGPLNLLSMGMTQDFEVAIEEGADMVRVGTAVFEGLPEELRLP